MEANENISSHDKVEEGPIVGFADTVIEPHAVMIEFRAAPVARAAVLREFTHVALADGTAEDVIVILMQIIETLSLFIKLSDHGDNGVSGVCQGGLEVKSYHRHQENGVNYLNSDIGAP